MLEVSDLTAGYGRTDVLHGVNLRVKKGTIVSLIGANGAGKTTLLMAISGVLKDKTGLVRFEGEDITELKAEMIVRKGISQVPEGRRIFGLLTVRENLELGAYLRRDKRSIYHDIEMIEGYFPILKKREHQLARTLSGGEQQMLALGRALMARPRMLLLDEPSLGLAPMVVEKIFEVIRKINRAGTTILLVEQNAFMALEISDHAYVLETGRLAFEGKASQLLENPEIRKAYLGE